MNMKQWIALFVIMLVVIGVCTSCSPPNPTASTSLSTSSAVPQGLPSSQMSGLAENGSSVEAESSGEGALADAWIPDPELSADLPVPDFLTEDQQQLYRAAYRMYYHFSMSGGFALDRSVSIQGDNERTFYLDKGFESYSAFQKALESVFTEDYANRLRNDTQLYMDDGNDRLFSSPGDRGGNIDYVSTSFELVSQSAEELTFHLIGHYREDAGFGEKGGSAKETTQEYPIHMVRTENGWRFDNFAMAF